MASGLHQRGFKPAAQAAAAHGCQRLVDGPEQRPLELVVALGAGQFQIAARLGIEHQGIALVAQLGAFEWRRMEVVVLQGPGVLQVGEQASSGA